MLFSKFLMEKESKNYSKFMRWLAKDICNYMNDDFNDYDFMQNIVKILRNTDLIDELGINGVEFNPRELPHPVKGWCFLFQLDWMSFKPHLDLKSFNLSIGTSLSSSGVYCMIYYIYLYARHFFIFFYCLDISIYKN